MRYRLKITRPAKLDIYEAFDWWSRNRSAEQAEKWYEGVYDAMRTLKVRPERCGFAVERELFSEGIRQLACGIGRRPTHRILFAIKDDKVVVLRVRHTSQDALGLDDLQL